MTLLCISLCVLLLLPFTLSCDRNPPEVIACGFRQVVQTELEQTKAQIAELQQNPNSSCRIGKRLNCTSQSNTTDIVNTLIALACKMKLIDDTNYLARSVEASINCFCEQNGQKRRERENNKKLCRAMAFLSNMEKCYQLLNAKYEHLTPSPCIS